MSLQGGYVLTTDVNGETTWSNPTSAVLTGFLSGTGTITGTDTILTSIQKLDGDIQAISTSISSLNLPSTLVERDGTGMSAFGQVQTDSIENYTGSTGATMDIASQSSTETLNLGCSTSVQVINVGTGTGATTINLGSSSDSVVIGGTLTVVNATNLEVVNKVITLNDSGITGSGGDAGINIEENSVVEGYFRVSTDRTRWVSKAPAGAELNVTPLETSAPTPNTLVSRDANGRSDFVSLYDSSALNVNSLDITPSIATTLSGTWLLEGENPIYSRAGEVRLKRIGDIVFINITAVGAANANISVGYFSFSQTAPVGFRPPTNNREVGFCLINNGSATNYSAGTILIIINGVIIVQASAGNDFVNGTPAGWISPIQTSFRLT